MTLTDITTPRTLARNLASVVAVPLHLLDQLHELHMRQWGLEDFSRATTASEPQIAHAKRAIDASNTQRHRLINAIDAAVRVSPPSARCRYYSETIGELCDRLLIFELKLTAAPAGSLNSLCGHLNLVVEQLMSDIDAGCAALPFRVGLKVYNGHCEEGT